MWNPLPLIVDLRVHHHFRAEIILVQLVVQLPQGAGGQSFALLGLPVGRSLELREHGLTEQRPPEAFQKMVNQIPFLLRLLRPVQQVPDQQRLVAGGSHLRHKNLVTGVDIGLGGVRIIGVDGVPHLMGQGEHVVQGAVEIHQHVGMAAVDAPGICAAAFSLVLVDVHPAVLKTLPKDFPVLLPQRGKALCHDGFCLLVGVGPVKFRHHGHIQIVHVDVVQAQGLLAHPDVAVQQGQILPDGGHQVVVDQLRHLVLRQGVLAAGSVIPGLCVEHRLLHIGGKCSRQGIAKLPIHAVQAKERVPADSAVLVLHQGNVIAVGNRHFLAVLTGDGGEFHIRVVEHVENLGSPLGGIVGLGQQLLHGAGQRVLPLSQNPLHQAAIQADAIFRLHVGGQQGRVHFQDFRHNEGGALRGLKGQGLGPPKHVLVGLFGRVLIGAHPGVHVKALDIQRNLVVKFQAAVQRLGGLRQSVLEIPVPLHLGGRFLKQRLPGLVVRHHVLQFPCITDICFTAFFHRLNSPFIVRMGL